MKILNLFFSPLLLRIQGKDIWFLGASVLLAMAFTLPPIFGDVIQFGYIWCFIDSDKTVLVPPSIRSSLFPFRFLFSFFVFSSLILFFFRLGCMLVFMGFLELYVLWV